MHCGEFTLNNNYQFVCVCVVWKQNVGLQFSCPEAAIIAFVSLLHL